MTEQTAHHYQLEQASIRFGTIIYLPAAISGGDVFSEDLEEALEDGFGDKSWRDAWGTIGFPDIDAILPEDARRSERSDYYNEAFYRRDLAWFLVKVEIPVPTYQKGFSGHSFSWGYYQSHWLAARTIDEAIRKAVAWRDEYHAKKLSEAA